MKSDKEKAQRATHRLCLYVPVWLKSSVVELAAKQEVSVSELVKTLLTEAVKKANKK